MSTNIPHAADPDSLDFTTPTTTSASQLRKGAVPEMEMPTILDYTKWEAWLEWFAREAVSLPWGGKTVSAAFAEYVKAHASWGQWRPDVSAMIKRSYDKYSRSLEDKGFEPMGKGKFVELFVKELKNIPSKLYAQYLKKEELETRAKNFRGVALANPGNSELRKLRDLADTLALGRAKFSYETAEKIPENPCVRLRLAIDELAAKIESHVKKPSEPESILTTPVSELVSRALAGFGIGANKKKQ